MVTLRLPSIPTMLKLASYYLRMAAVAVIDKIFPIDNRCQDCGGAWDEDHRQGGCPRDR